MARKQKKRKKGEEKLKIAVFIQPPHLCACASGGLFFKRRGSQVSVQERQSRLLLP
jgi:hypothetical protein